MTQDPEILDPAPRADARDATSAPTELVEGVVRAFPGAVIRVEGHRIDVEGDHHALRIVRTPLVAMAVFRGMRIPLPADPALALTLLQGIARGERVLVEERGAGALRRTHLVTQKDGALQAIEDTTVDRDAIAAGTMRVVSFTAPVRDATEHERRFIHRASGGVVGRFKRKLMEKLLDKTLGAMVEAVQGAVAGAQPNAGRAPDGRAIDGDDGSHTLPPSSR